MKLIVATIFILIVSFMPGRRQSVHSLWDDGCKTILDSAKVMVENGEMTIRRQKRSTNYDRFNAVSIWIQQRPFNELKCLIQYDHPLYRLYGYLIAMMQYTDSLDKKFSYILEDTTSLQMIGDMV